VIQRVSLNKIDFDMIGVHASIANTVRRILIAEVRQNFSRISVSPTIYVFVPVFMDLE
jgi:hypothetical protein